MSGHGAEFAALAEELLTAGRVDELFEQLAEPDLIDVWDDVSVVGAVAEAYGRHAAPGGLMDVAALGDPDSVLLLDVPGGRRDAVVVDADGTARIDGVIRGGSRLHLAGVVGGELRRFAIDSLDVVPVPGFDPGTGLHRVTGALPAGAGEASGLDADRVRSAAARYLAHELIGAADGALALATAHVRDRQQFGVAIGSFQAVRHRLAEAYVHVTAARGLLAAVGPHAGLETHLLVLKASAGFAAQTAVAAAQQVCGGMGFTEEFGLHRFVRRTYVLDSLMGGAEAAEELLGRAAINGRVLPDRQVVLS